MVFELGETLQFAGTDSVVQGIEERNGQAAYLIANGQSRLPMWIPGNILESHQAPGRPDTQFHSRSPSVLVVDEFFRDPDEIRAIALTQHYESDLRFYKGYRTHDRFLWPHLREEFGRLLGKPVTEWLGHRANGVFQQTSCNDPLVWHHDSQGYAAAVYLTPGGSASTGTSFWQDRTHGCRRRPTHALEANRLGNSEAVKAAEAVVYDPYNFEHPENWELIESVAGIYNRLVIWDASLIHSATSYSEFSEEEPESTRLVQLFFFDAD